MKHYRVILRNVVTGEKRTIDRQLDETDYLELKRKFDKKKIESYLEVIGLYELS